MRAVHRTINPSNRRWKAPGRSALPVLFPILYLLPLALWAPQALAQDDVVELLRRQRSERRAAELFGEHDGRIAPRDPAYLGEPTIYWLWHARALVRQQLEADSLVEATRRAREDSLARLPVTLEAIRWEKVEPDDQETFLDAYAETFWHAAPRLPALDTVATPRLRALLNGLFGAPTRNAAAAEQEGYAGSEFVQFEYWLVVNDSIPVLVLDRDGPFGRGLLVAGDEQDSRYLPLLTQDLAARLAAARPTPYADYYHSSERSGWFEAGFDGTAYYVEEARRPRWADRRNRNDRWRIFR